MKVNNEVEYTVSMKDLLSGKIKAATAETNKLQSAVGGVKNTINSIGGALGIGIGVAGIASFGRAVIDSLKNYEYFSASLRTLMHGDAEVAKALETQLVSLASKTPFSLTEVQDATKQLLAFGFAAGDVTKNISMLGDVASALKIPFSDIAYLYGTLKTQGRAYNRDIMQFTQRGIPVIKELAKQFGVTEAEVMKMVEAGKVGFPQVEKAFQSMTSQGGMIFNMMAEQSKTVGGQISNLGDNWEQLKVNIGKSQTGIISGTVAWANEMISVMGQFFKRQNQMDEDFKKSGAKQTQTWETYLNSILEYTTHGTSGLGDVHRVNTFNDYIQKNYVEAPAKTLAEARKQYAHLVSGLYKLDEENLFDKNSREYQQKRAILLGAIKAQQAQEKLLRGGAKVDANGNPITSTTSSSISPIKASAPKATQINITFGKLIEKQIVEAPEFYLWTHKRWKHRKK